MHFEKKEKNESYPDANRIEIMIVPECGLQVTVRDNAVKRRKATGRKMFLKFNMDTSELNLFY